MATFSRAGTGLLLAGGLLLAALMGYTLLLDDPGRVEDRPPAGVADVAVFYPGRDDWLEFRRGIAACTGRGLARVVQETDRMTVLETPQHRRLVRFSWHDTGGLVQTRAAVRRLVATTSPPVALVGSSNTVLTVGLAEELNASTRADRPGPVLLIPWATSIRVPRPEAGAEPVDLLKIWPDRTFRFCPNNQHLADLLVRCLADHEAVEAPLRVDLVVDDHDPYSVDLADCFRRAIRREIGPETSRVEITEHSGTLSVPGPGGRDEAYGAAESTQAEAIWKAARADPRRRVTWVILPLQGRPARRMLTALLGLSQRDLDPWNTPVPVSPRLHVLCGDGIGPSALSALVRKEHAFPVWCVSPASIPAPGTAATPAAEEAQIPAEIVAAVLRGLDRPWDAPGDLRDALAGRALGAQERGAMGRSLAFTASGERQGDDLGHVLMIQPGRRKVLAYARNGDGQWGQAVELPLVADTW